mgnify:CR=1 FL=1
MCTVSFVSAGDKKIITSNRDEHIGRQTAYPPAAERINGRQLIFPKDPKAGGTWFAVSERGAVSVLLNGAFARHTPAPPYRKSRGLVLLDITAAESPVAAFEEMELYNIEPFTLVHYQPAQLYELRWDGDNRYQKELDASGNHIWSSSTLYKEEVVNYRRGLFDTFIGKTMMPDSEAVFGFHANNNNDEENGFVINRKTGLKTFSITQAVWEPGRIGFSHADLLQGQRFEHDIPVVHSLVTSP